MKLVRPGRSLDEGAVEELLDTDSSGFGHRSVGAGIGTLPVTSMLVHLIK